MFKGYKYRLLPTEEQKIKLNNAMGACRFIYNLSLETKIRAWESGRVNLSAYDLMKQLTELKKSGLADWLKEIPALPVYQAISNLDKAFKGFFKGGGFPKFKKKSNAQSIHFRQSLKLEEGKIRLERIGWVMFIQHRQMPDGVNIRSATVSVTPSGVYFVSVLVDTNDITPEKSVVKPETAVGIDLGIKTFAVLSDGSQYENPRFLLYELKRLRVEQRTLARRYKKWLNISEQSKGWNKQRLVVAKFQEKIANKRSDFLHKTSTAIVKQFDTICLEDLNVKGMLQNKNLSKAISDVSWSEFVRQVEYKADWGGKNVVRINTFAPSSKTCSDCGVINSDLKLSEREWQCECGVTHDRDLNAALNIKQMGLTQSLQSLT